MTFLFIENPQTTADLVYNLLLFDSILVFLVFAMLYVKRLLVNIRHLARSYIKKS